MFMFPPELTPLLIYVITNGVKSLLNVDNLARVWSILIAAFVGAVLLFGESVINGFGPPLPEIAGGVVNALLLILGGLGVHDSLKRFSPSNRA